MKKPLITKNEFLKYMGILVSTWEFDTELSSLYYKYKLDAVPPMPLSIDTSLEMLEKLMCVKQDEFGYSTITWWFYEDECGKGGRHMYFGEEEIEINTIEDLWNVCLRELEEYEDE